MDVEKYLQKRRNQLAMRGAEKFALARSPIAYEPNEPSRLKSIAEAQSIKLGLCAHGKIPRLIGERMIANGSDMPRSAICRRCC